MDIVLRNYQQRDIERTRDAFRSGARRVLYVSPTGSGKTTFFCAVAQSAIELGGYVRAVVHRRELKKQVSERMAAFDINAGADVEMVRAAARGRKPSLLIVDEAHHAAAGSWQAVLEAYHDVPVLGVSATPCRLDGRGLGEAFDRMVIGPSTKELTNEGHLVPARIWAPSAPDMRGAGKRAGDWKTEDIARAVERSSVTGDAVQHYLNICPNARAVAFCVDVEHARRTAAAFNAAGVPADVILGEQKDGERDRVVAGLATGEIRVLCSVDVVSEGFDIPEIEAVILLRPTQSLALFLQQIGRCLRPFPGKEFAYVLDHAGNVLRHGFPDDDFEWSLDAGVKRKNASDLLRIRRCTECFGIYRAGPQECPYCGASPDAAARRAIEEREGQLQRLDKDLRASLRSAIEAKKAEFKRDTAAAVSLKELLAVAKKHQKSPAWAHALYKSSAWRQRIAHDRKASSQA